MKKYFLLIFCFCSIYLNAQNLIQNPSLENLKPTVDIENMWGNQFQESINLADEGWFRAWWTPNLINDELSEHIKYFQHFGALEIDSLNILIEENVDFFFPARTGNQYAASHVYYSGNDSPKEIFGYELEQELIEGEEYCMSFHVKLGQGMVSGVDQIGALFHNERRTSASVSEWEVWTSFTPQIMSPIGEPIVDLVNWTEISGSFIADGTEKYIYFGVFEHTDNLTIDTLGQYINGLVNFSIAPYFWDDFSLYKCGEESFPADAGKSECITIGDSIQLGSHDYEDYFYEWRVNDSVFSTEGMPWVSPDTTSIYGLYQQDFAFNETWSQVSVVVVENPEDKCVGLGVNEQLDSEIHVYPNPVDQILNFTSSKSGAYQLVIHDISGKEILNSKFDDEIEFNTSKWNQGIYTYSVTGIGKVKNGKFIVIH